MTTTPLGFAQTETTIPIITLTLLGLAISHFLGFTHAVALLADSAVVSTVPKRVNDGIQILSVTSGAKHFAGVLVGVMAIAVTAILA